MLYYVHFARITSARTGDKLLPGKPLQGFRHQGLLKIKTFQVFKGKFLKL